MEKVEFLNVNPHKAVRFLHHICIAVKSRKEQEKFGIHDQIHEIKGMLKSKNLKKGDIYRKMELLDSKVKTHLPDKPPPNTVFQRIQHLGDDMDKYLSSIEDREGRIEKIEEDIVTESKSKSPHRKKIKELEKKFQELESQNKFDISQLERVRKKINYLKKKS